jgi:hypothetical protein
MKFLLCFLLFSGLSLYALSANVSRFQPETDLFLTEDSGNAATDFAAPVPLKNRNWLMTSRATGSITPAGSETSSCAVLAYSDSHLGKAKNEKACIGILQSWKAKILFPVHYYK